MSIFSLLAAVVATTPLGWQEPSPITVKFGKRTVSVAFKNPINLDYDGDIDEWAGWGDLKGEAPKVYVVDRPFELADAVPAADAAVYRAKFIVYQRIDALQKLPSGVTLLRRGDLEEPQLNAVLADIARTRAHILKQSDGKVDFVADVDVRDELYRTEVSNATGQLNLEAWRQELEFHSNGGTYEAEDRQYRGPYHGYFVISALSPDATVFTRLGPVWGAPSYALGAYGQHALRARLDLAWRDSIFTWMGRRGITAWPTGEVWKSAMNFAEPSPTEYAASMATSPATIEVPATPGLELGVRSPDMDVALLQDAEKGIVLSITERNVGRSGGAALSMPLGGIDPSTRKTLTFEARQTGKDPIALVFNGSVAVSLGADRLLTGEVTRTVPFERNGSWQTVRVPLDQLGLQRITSIAVEPAPGGFRRGKLQSEPVEFRVTNFKFSPEATPVGRDLDASDTAVTALAGKQEIAESELLSILDGTDRDLQVNALERVPKSLTEAGRQAVLKATASIDPRVAQAAVRAYATGPAETTALELRRVMQFGLTDLARVEAAKLVAKNVDPKEAGYVSVLLGDRRANVRLGGLQALTQLRSREAGIIRLAYITQEDPSIKCLVTDFADSNDDYQMRKVLWSAVNEPWDAVRYKSMVKLVESPIEAFRQDGYRGIKDDSVSVRVTFANYLASTPKESHRTALRQGIFDRDSRVRSTCLRGLGALGTVAVEDVSSLFADEYPAVQMQLVSLARAGKLALPAETVAKLKQSPYPIVRTTAQELSGS